MPGSLQRERPAFEPLTLSSRSIGRTRRENPPRRIPDRSPLYLSSPGHRCTRRPAARLRNSPGSAGKPRTTLIKAFPVFAAALAVMVMLGSGILDELILPSRGVPVRPFPDDAAPAPAVLKASLAKSGLNEPVELVFTLHKVAKGETLSRIAYNYGLTPATLISVNALERPDDVYAGRFLTIPYRDGIRVSPGPGESVADMAARMRTKTEMVQSIPDSGDLFVSGGLADESLPSAFLRDVFLYPVSGRVITAYGRGMDPLTGISFESEGIDLSVEPGTAVTASRTGTVIRTGNHSAYGLYVIMSHPGGWRSFYGNLGRIAVAPGDVLEGGWQIGTAGSSGSVRSPRLHFVLIRDGETVDPLDYLF